MTVYARNDLAAVTISEAHGGCNQAHARPAPGGVPAATWELHCDKCEDFLRHDPLWSVTSVEIPETYDETKARENFEKRGAKDKDAILTLALARLAGIGQDELPESLTRMISGVPAHVPAEMECPQGHGQPAGRKFCAECGSPMHGAPAAAAIEQPAKAAEPPAQRARLQDLTLPRLQKLARDRQMDSEGTRSDLIARLRAAGVKNSDLAAPVAA
jgi:hypothetical protein